MLSRLQLPLRLALVAHLTVPAASWAQATDFAGTTADIVAWNLSGFTPIPDARHDELVQVLKDLDAEIVAVVEVNPDEVLADLASELTEEGACYQAAMLAQSASQNIGLLFKCEAAVGNLRFVPNSDDGNNSLRLALAADVTVGAFDFLLIAVHLKAGRSTSDRQIRDRQAAHIATFIGTETAGAERDV